MPLFPLFYSALLFCFINFILGDAKLSPAFYEKPCPQALQVIRESITAAVIKEPRMGASLIRLHFHDCSVQGCDASIMLDETPTMESEKNAAPNLNSARGFDIIEATKAKLEMVCPGIVSCADIIAVAARDSSHALGGPTWDVKLGRRDSLIANKTLANEDIPSFRDTIEVLSQRFLSKGLTERDLVALSGAHTIGQARCATFRERIYSNSSNIAASFAKERQKTCPLQKGQGDNNLAPLDKLTPEDLNNDYYRNLLTKMGLLGSDAELTLRDSTRALVSLYKDNPDVFISDFAVSMVQMGDIAPLTGSSGEIRKLCNRVNVE